MVLEARNEKRIKCVVVGDDSIGKTSMLLGYATNRYPTQHVPSVFDNHAGKSHVLVLSYILCFSVYCLSLPLFYVTNVGVSMSF